MFVARMIFLFPSSGLRNTFDCSSEEMEEWSSRMVRLREGGMDEGREGGREGEEGEFTEDRKSIIRYFSDNTESLLRTQ